MGAYKTNGNTQLTQKTLIIWLLMLLRIGPGFLVKLPSRLIVKRTMAVDIGGMRKPYNDKEDVFDIKDLTSREPFGQFKSWFETASSHQDIEEANAMCLCTASTSGLPSARIPAEDSDSYFHSRPFSSQLGALVSDQSKVVANRGVLDTKNRELEEKYGSGDEQPSRPDWGGYLVVPRMVEFWQGQSNRIHDRIRFRKMTKDETLNPETSHQGEDGW